MSAVMADTALAAKLRERGQRVTSQRLVIHRVLSARDQHLTAEQVLNEVSDSLPGISLPTVYATLELFEELGLIRRVLTGSGALMFDSRLSPHAHTICRGCGSLCDVELSASQKRALSVGGNEGFQADRAELIIWGRCSDCAERED